MKENFSLIILVSSINFRSQSLHYFLPSQNAVIDSSLFHSWNETKDMNPINVNYQKDEECLFIVYCHHASNYSFSLWWSILLDKNIHHNSEHTIISASTNLTNTVMFLVWYFLYPFPFVYMTPWDIGYHCHCLSSHKIDVRRLYHLIFLVHTQYQLCRSHFCDVYSKTTGEKCWAGKWVALIFISETWTNR